MFNLFCYKCTIKKSGLVSLGFLTLILASFEVFAMEPLLPQESLKITTMQRLADEGDRESCRTLAFHYTSGDANAGVERNQDKALHYFRLAAENGDAESALILARTCSAQADIGEAFYYYTRAIGAESEIAKADLEFFYFLSENERATISENLKAEMEDEDEDEEALYKVNSFLTMQTIVGMIKTQNNSKELLPSSARTWVIKYITNDRLSSRDII